MIVGWSFVTICILFCLANVVDGQKNIKQQTSSQDELSFFMPTFLQSPYISLGFGLVGTLMAYQHEPTALTFAWMLLIALTFVGMQHSVAVALQRGIENQSQRAFFFTERVNHRHNKENSYKIR